MLNFQRIICIWICCVSCMFGTTQLSTSLVQAVPYEYFDDHDQSFYDLDTEQIQAKYDTRLLSQQMLPTETQKGFHNDDGGGGHKYALENRKQNNAGLLYGSVEKLKNNENENVAHNDWLEQQEETVTRAASSSSTSAFTDTLDELHLPRAASCFTNGQKYTHGQKVPRLDSCEVCLCMDGEIFCWWEKCDKKPAITSSTYDDFSTPSEELSTTRMQLNSKTTFKTTLKPMKKPKTTNEDYKYDDDDSAEIREMQQEYEGLKEQLLRDEHEYEQESANAPHTQKPDRNRKKQMMKKKIYQQQEEEKHKKKIKEQNQNWKQQQQQQQQQQKQHHVHTHNNNNNNKNKRQHDNGSNGPNSKILNFPENLPSVLYYDYKTEEHHQHQHQHREQHLKHQKQKQQQHEKELKLRQQQQQQQKKLLQQQQEQKYHHKNHHHEYGQDFHTYNFPDGMELEMVANNGNESPSRAFKYFNSGNENNYNQDLQTDSDILPEPPTKKPKFLTSIPADTMVTANTIGTPSSQLYRLSTATTAQESTTPKIELTKAPNILTSSAPLQKQNLLPWDTEKTKNEKANGNNNGQSNTNNKSDEDLMDTEDQDDAFHRWLTSTEMNNKNNFTLNETNSKAEGDANGVGRDFDGINSDYHGDERIYENIEFATDTGHLATVNNTKETVTVAATGFSKYNNDENVENSNNNGYNSNYNTPFSQIYQNFNKNNNQPGTVSSSSSVVSDGVISATTSNEDNGVASVVNIDIMLTASSAETQTPQLTNNQQQQLEQQLQNFEHEKQIAKAYDKSMQSSPHFISTTHDAGAAVTTAKDNKNRMSLIENDNNSNSNNNNNLVGDNTNTEIQNMGGNNINISSSISNTNDNMATSYSSSSSSDSFKLKNLPTLLMSQTNAILSTASPTITLSTATPTATTPPTLSTTSSPERQCNVMGTLYKIGDILPQDTGNCLQCICIDGSTSDDTPRVTCSPHNCPPLVLPDLFDATGY